MYILLVEVVDWRQSSCLVWGNTACFLLWYIYTLYICMHIPIYQFWIWPPSITLWLPLLLNLCIYVLAWDVVWMVQQVDRMLTIVNALLCNEDVNWFVVPWLVTVHVYACNISMYVVHVQIIHTCTCTFYTHTCTSLIEYIVCTRILITHGSVIYTVFEEFMIYTCHIYTV